MGQKEKSKIVQFLKKSGERTINVYTVKTVPHPVYKKYVKKTIKYLVDFNSDDSLLPGEKIYIQSCRPLSKRKSYRYVGRVKKGSK